MMNSGKLFASMLNRQQKNCVVRGSTADLFPSSTLPPFASVPYYGNVATEKLNILTRAPLDTIAAVVNALEKIWVSGHRYAKAGIMLNEFSPNGVSQLNLFDKIQRGHTVMS